MNYGRFFRLNQALSKVGSGVAIYDYVDLPAYFGPSVDNPMSPKYPISVTIAADSVCFRLHYSAFKLDKSGDCEFPQYAYDKDDINNKSLNKDNVSVGMAHMEEVILELPFADISSSRLSDTIKSIYNSTFPQVIDENTSMGGRYLEQLIKKRFPVKKDEVSANHGGNVEESLYRNLRKVSDETASYSTLSLMDLVHEDRIYLYSKQKVLDDRTKQEKEIDIITGFLRKLLLDFMFDLKHSDVFQNSASYQKMFSGFMSDFYFSALIHKCEYYYYRRLTRQAIDTIENEDVDDKERKKAIATLYASELVKAEDLWIKDIMNPHAEEYFEYRYPGNWFYKILREVIETYHFQQWPSWFAEPEEEMRRVCFTMKDESGERHICNGETVISYLKLNSLFQKKSKEEKQAVKKLIDIQKDDKEKISRWFLKHYAFSDVFHLHFFKYFNIIFLIFIAFPVLLTLFTRLELQEIGSYIYDKGLIALPYLLIAGAILCVVNSIRKIYIWIKQKSCKSCGQRIVCDFFLKGINPRTRATRLVRKRQENVGRRFIWLSLFMATIFFLLYFGVSEERKKYIEVIPTYFLYGGGLAVFIFVMARLRSIISSLHLFLPRLVASITLAWITLSMGFDLYVSFFDAEPKFPYTIGICVVVLFFVMYSINIVIPHSTPIRKFLRALNLMVVSYLISLAVGFVAINFLGEKFLERSGYMNDFYTENVGVVGKDKKVLYNKNQQATNGLHVIDTLKNCSDKIDILLGKTEKDTSEFYKNQVSNLEYIYHADMIDGKTIVNSNYPLVERIKFFGKDIFILRDFLIMFSFVAMFIGIFIQLIIFGDNKQMTEL